MALSVPIHPLNEQLFKLEIAIEANDLRMRALSASIDRVCIPWNAKKLHDTAAPDYPKTRAMVRDLIRSYAAVRATARRLQGQYAQAYAAANRLPPSA